MFAIDDSGDECGGAMNKMRAYFSNFKLKISPLGSMLCMLLCFALGYQGTDDFSVLLISCTLLLLVSIVYFSSLSTSIVWQLTPLSLLLIFWLLWVCLLPGLGFVANSALFGIFQCALWIAVFFIFDLSSSKQRLESVIFQTTWFLSLVCALYALFQFFILHQMPCGFFANKNSAAAFFMIMLLTLIGMFLTLHENRVKCQQLMSKEYRFFLAFSIFILMLAMLSAFSRGVAISFCCGLVLELLLLRRFISRKRLVQLIGLFILALSILLIVAQPEIKHRLALLQQEKSRLVIWQGAWQLWQQMPWYGIGIFNFMHYYPAFSLPGDDSTLQYAHNDFLQLLIETGVPGVLILFSILLIVNRVSWRYLVQRQEIIDEVAHIRLVICFVVLISFALHSLVDFNFYVLIMNLLLGCYLGSFHQILRKEGLIGAWEIKLVPHLQRVLFSLGLVFFLFMSVSAGRLFMMRYYIDQADMAMKKHDLPVALQMSKNAAKWLDLAELHAQSADLYLKLAIKTVDKTKQMELARQMKMEINQAISINPYYARPYFQMGLFEALLVNNQEKAQHFFYESLKKDPHDCLARLTFGGFLIEQNKVKKARHLLEKGLAYPIPTEYAERYSNYLGRVKTF